MIHVLASYHVQEWKYFIEQDIEKQVTRLLEEQGLHVVKTTRHSFPGNEGLTVVWLLAESHCALHTYKEYETVFIDIFSCKPNHDIDNLFDLLYGIGDLFQGILSEKRIIRRQPA